MTGCRTQTVNNMVRPPLVRLKAFKDFSCRPFKVPQRLFKGTWTHAFQAGWGFEPEFRRQGFVYRGAAKSSQLMNSSNPILCPFFPGSVCTRRHARHTLPTLTFTLTFTLHLQIDGASSRSIERHFYSIRDLEMNFMKVRLVSHILQFKNRNENPIFALKEYFFRQNQKRFLYRQYLVYLNNKSFAAAG